MSSTDSTSDLESRIAAIVERNVGRLRDELLHRVQQTESHLKALDRRMGGQSGAAAPPAPAAAAAPAAEPSAGPAALDELFAAVVAIDRSGSQQEVLAALLEGAGRFAGRSALFLTRADSAQGWGSYGFEGVGGEFQDKVLDYGDGPLATLSEGSGCVALGAAECGELCGQLGAGGADEGLLLPFVLRDKVAAALYVDRAAGDPPLERHAVQLLTWTAAQAVEGLGLRQRSETPTLQMADGGAAAGVSLWEGAPATETAPPAPPEPAAPAAAPEQPAAEALATEVELDLDVAVAEPVADSGAMEADWQEMDFGAAQPEAAEAQIAEPQLAEPQIAEPEIPEPEISEPEAAEPADTRSLGDLMEPAAPEPIDETAPAGLGTTMTEAPAPEQMAPPASGPPMGGEMPAGGTDSTMVQPPQDVAGPGWAFTASRGSTEAGDEARHEEARRLARLLVTEIKLYNEEQVEEGRRSKDIYGRLKEDIDRSRQIFNERVDEEVRGETDYFQEEMVRILAGGDAEALGV